VTMDTHGAFTTPISDRYQQNPKRMARFSKKRLAGLCLTSRFSGGALTYVRWHFCYHRPLLFGTGTDFLEPVCDQDATFCTERSLAVLASDTAT
jgi:hypothetical protein